MATSADAVQTQLSLHARNVSSNGAADVQLYSSQKNSPLSAHCCHVIDRMLVFWRSRSRSVEDEVNVSEPACQSIHAQFAAVVKQPVRKSAPQGFMSMKWCSSIDTRTSIASTRDGLHSRKIQRANRSCFSVRESKDPKHFRDMEHARQYLHSRASGPSLPRFIQWLSESTARVNPARQR